MKDEFGIAGQVAIITGGSSGLGATSAVALARCGVKVVVSGRNSGRCDSVVSAIRDSGGDAVGFPADVRHSREVDSLFAFGEQTYGRVDIAVHSAGIFDSAPTLSVDDERWARVLETNLFGAFYSCRAAGRHMLPNGRGKIVNVASTDAFLGLANEAAYCSSKGGLVQLTRALAVEWIKSGVYVNAIGPSDFRTPMNSEYEKDERYWKRMQEIIPMGRPGEPAEMVGALIFLCSSASDFVVGQCIMVDGGRTVI